VKVILLKEVPSLGRPGEIREVKDGYARNYLMPRGLAAPATEGNLQTLAQTREAAQQRESRLLEEMNRLKTALETLVVEVRAKAGDEGRLFGSVTAQDIAEALSRKGFEITKKQVELDEPIKTAGFYKVTLRLHPKHTAKVEVNVVGAK
jgi:large subunit ribosomal protein L9